MMRTEESEERGRVNEWVARLDPERRQKARDVAGVILGDEPTVSVCEIVDRELTQAYLDGKIVESRLHADRNDVVKMALQKAERALDPQHSRTCAAVELMLKKGGVSENDRNVIARTCDCQVSPDDALTAVREVLREFT